MSVDWIKMQPDLYRHPKVILMAERLMDPREPLGRYVNQNCQCSMAITLNVMRNATVGALVSVWGVTRHRGKRDGHNLSLPGHTLEVIDGIADIPGFGAAMELVGWLIDTGDSIVLPNFFRELNVDPLAAAIEKRREGDRKRKRKSRDVSRGRSRDGHGTIPPKSKSKSKSINTPLTPHSGEEEIARPADNPARPKKPAPAIPAELDTEEFRVAWAAWEKHRREIKKTLTPTTLERQFKTLLGFGVARAIRALENSIEQGYTGIVEPRGPVPGAPSSNGTGHRERFNAALGDLP